MNIAVIGLGSMGKRRIRLIRQYDPSFKIVGVDLNAERCEQVRRELGIETCGSIDEAVEKHSVEAVFISTSPLSHAAIITDCLNHGLNVFTELNLVDKDYEKNMALAKEKNAVLFLSSTFLYREEVGYIANAVSKSEKPVRYNYHVGQYLPDWHPWESYKNFFVGDKRTNGCREIFAIELPWIINTFGKIKSFSVVRDKATDLDIDYPDNYLLVVEHENGNKGTLCVDVISRKAVRNLEVYGECLHLRWDGTPNGLFEYDIENKAENNVSLYEKVDKLSGYSSNIIENAYFAEVSNFFGSIKKEETPKYSFEKDKDVLNFISQIEGEF